MTLSNPAAVMARLEEIDADLALRQNDLEIAALGWFRAKREREKAWAEALLVAEGSTADARRAEAIRASAHIGREEEAAYEALKAVCRVLDTRASIGQSILKAHGRA